jgi:hypothetical protein
MDSDSRGIVQRSGEGNRLFAAQSAFLTSENESALSHLAHSTNPPVEQGGGECVLNLLHDLFRRSQHVTDKEFITRLEQRGIEHTAPRVVTTTYLEGGRFC